MDEKSAGLTSTKVTLEEDLAGLKEQFEADRGANKLDESEIKEFEEWMAALEIEIARKKVVGTLKEVVA